MTESLSVLLSNTKAYVSTGLFVAANTSLLLKERFSNVSRPVTFNAVFASLNVFDSTFISSSAFVALTMIAFCEAPNVLLEISTREPLIFN